MSSVFIDTNPGKKISKSVSSLLKTWKTRETKTQITQNSI